jgi:hypothetical protein
VNTLRTLYHLARADFLERTRRYSFLVMLGLVLLLGYLSASGQIRMRIGLDYFGIVNSAWVGAQTALTVTMLLGFLGFYIVKGSVSRDYTTGVGQIVATTPLSRSLYMLGKWLSNYAVLGIALVIVALAGVAMILLFGTGSLDVAALVTPLALIAVPFVGLVAALALLFESVPWLRGSLGNVIYFCLYMGIIMATVIPFALDTPGGAINPYIDVFAWQIIGESVSRSAQAVYPGGGVFSFGGLPDLGETPDLKLFPYNGIEWTTGILLSRLLVLLVALALVALASLLFDRFDPARPLPIKRKTAAPNALQPAPAAEAIPVTTVRLTPLSDTGTRFRFDALLTGELKLFLKGQPWWWYAVAAGLVVAQMVTSLQVTRYLLMAAWVWPILILSGLGCRENQFDTRQIVFSAPRPMSQLPAGWLSAVLVTALLGSGALVRFLLAGDPVAVLGWLTAILFIPSLALALGTLTGSGKAFEVLYVLWMYGLTQQVPAIDFAALVPGSHFYLYAPVAIGLMAIAALARRRQLQAT